MEATNNIFFGLFLTLAVSSIFKKLKSRSRATWFNPMIFSTFTIICILILFDIPFENYNIGGQLINQFLGPITVLLAVPLYRNWAFLKHHTKAILVGVLFGSFAALLSIYLFSLIFGLDQLLMRSILGRSVTTPIGIAISEMIEANSSIVVVSIMISGVSAVFMADFILKILGINHPVAKGVALGTTAHAIGTAKAMELGRIEGAMSALSIGLAGIITVVWVSIFHFILPII